LKLVLMSYVLLVQQTVDENFTQQELRFNALEECVPALLQNLTQYLDFLQVEARTYFHFN